MRIIKMRMEDRLRYAIDVPADLRSRPLPALTLQPLVENAIVHGLEPQMAAAPSGSPRSWTGARSSSPSRTTAPASTRRPATLRAGSGTALANIRERLRQSHGDAAALRLEPVVPHGVRARLALPASR